MASTSLQAVSLIALFLALVGILFTSVQAFLVARLMRRGRPDGAAPEKPPRISILKPLRGLDDGLEENLRSFASLEGVDYEVILSVEDPHDPGLEAVARVCRDHPEAPFRLVVGGGPRAADAPTNPKVVRLLAAVREATGEVLFISDSNVRVTPRQLADTVALFADPSVGCVSNLFVGAGARTFGAVVESLHLLTFVVPGTALADAGNVACVVGKSMAIRRKAYEAIGGFARVLDVLAEDQATGLLVKAAGFSVVLAPVVVTNVIERRTLRAALARQVRWGKIRYAFSAATYTGELLLNPTATASVSLLAALLGGHVLAGAAAGLLATSVLARTLQGLALARVTGGTFGPVEALVLPVKDLLQLATQLVPYLSAEVVWHGHRARLGHGTRLLRARA